jgi:hypothetical protein
MRITTVDLAIQMADFVEQCNKKELIHVYNEAFGTNLTLDDVDDADSDLPARQSYPAVNKTLN